MLQFADNFRPFFERMRAEGLPEAAIKSFEYYYRQLVSGSTGFIPEAFIKPVTDLPDVETLPSVLSRIGQDALKETVLIKLNGGLGTTMGLNLAKSLLVVKNNLTFLDIVIRQAIKKNIPFVFMNSFTTHEDTLAALKQYSDFRLAIPPVFEQHKVPKIEKASLGPANWPRDRRLEWCPPGHGDIYASLVTSGTLDTLLSAGYKYAFVSNVDNLGAVMDTAILGHFVRNQFPFMMEVADRTHRDRKGGHLALRMDGRLVLRELAQCRPEELEAFQDTTRYRYFNTNNIWLNLPALKQIMSDSGEVLKLPIICNLKNIDPRDSNCTEVYQLETAMGSAIELFEGATAVRVPRIRFAPVKTTEDLLAIRSDLYCLTDNFRIVPNPARRLGHIELSLDPTHYRLIDHVEALFPHGAPSLLECKQLKIKGKIRFGRNVILKGCVKLVNDSPHKIDLKDDATVYGDSWGRL